MMRKQSSRERDLYEEAGKMIITYFTKYRAFINMTEEDWRNYPSVAADVYSFLSRFLRTLLDAITETGFLYYAYGYGYEHNQERESNLIINAIRYILNRMGYGAEEILVRRLYKDAWDAYAVVSSWLNRARSIIQQKKAEETPLEKQYAARDNYIAQIEKVAKEFLADEALRAQWVGLRDELINQLPTLDLPVLRPEEVSARPQGIPARYLGYKYLVVPESDFPTPKPEFLADRNLTVIAVDYLADIYKEYWLPHAEKWREVERIIDEIAREDKAEELRKLSADAELKRWWENVIRPYFFGQVAEFLAPASPVIELLLDRAKDLSWENIITILAFEEFKSWRQAAGERLLMESRVIRPLYEKLDELERLANQYTIPSKQVYNALREIAVEIETLLNRIHGHADYVIDCFIPTKSSWDIDLSEKVPEDVSLRDLHPDVVRARRKEEEETEEEEEYPYYEEETFLFGVLGDWDGYLNLAHAWMWRIGVGDDWKKYLLPKAPSTLPRIKRPFEKTAKEIFMRALLRRIRKALWGRAPATKNELTV